MSPSRRDGESFVLDKYAEGEGYLKRLKDWGRSTFGSKPGAPAVQARQH